MLVKGHIAVILCVVTRMVKRCRRMLVKGHIAVQWNLAVILCVVTRMVKLCSRMLVNDTLFLLFTRSFVHITVRFQHFCCCFQHFCCCFQHLFWLFPVVLTRSFFACLLIAAETRNMILTANLRPMGEESESSYIPPITKMPKAAGVLIRRVSLEVFGICDPIETN
jgi:hypothetical protein